MSCQHSRLKRPQTIFATFAILPFLLASQAWAAPHSNHTRDGGSGGGGGARTSVIRDLTAEEVAGTDATNQANAAEAARTDRRARRNRRTPSQISTRSLPAYMKEPGEQELVIIQGSQDMEDAPLTAQVVMPPVREDEDESANSHSANSHSRNPSQSSYVIVNDDPHVQTPFLEHHEITHERQSPNTHATSPSVDISDFSHHNYPSPPPTNPASADPRGEAPPYVEVVGDLSAVRATSGDLARVDTTDTLPIAPDSNHAPCSAGLIDAASRALSSPHSSIHPLPASRPSRDLAVSPSPRPSNLSNRTRSTRSPHMGHRTTPSNSDSILSVSSSGLGRGVTHSQSRINVTGGLPSSSTISITSISAPLTHTAVRTDFVYPRTGPTPEQLKLISSVESVSKFGVPYGPDAVAYASASLVNLHGPPPGFEEILSTDGLPGPSGVITRPRAASALSRMSRDVNGPEPRLSLSSLPPSSREPAIPSVLSQADESGSAASHPHHPERSPSSDLSEAESAPESELSDTKEPEVNNPVEAVPPRAPSPSPTVETVSTAATVIKATVSALGGIPGSPDDSAASVGHRPALPSLDAETATTLATSTTRGPAAPSSFRMASAPRGRTLPSSRTSSIETFRTAASGPNHLRESEHGMSDTEQETDEFTDAQSGTETDVETPPVTPHAVPLESTTLVREPPNFNI
ncbi:hypothetical protein F5148DRAFT_1155704 [Russula earlei]|uniref:Uncharacterized protein n=1 Tax=Russula earlei TaxID=71964 RepID=A0ACC0UP57_9AGAM|nr:hypothetical protein F5148DRAFT_1155704 [Russula earlei]